MADIPKFEDTEELHPPSFDETHAIDDTVLNNSSEKGNAPTIGIIPKAWQSFKDSLKSGHIRPDELTSDLIKNVGSSLSKEDIGNDPLANGIATGSTFGLNDEVAGVIGAVQDEGMGTGGEVPNETSLQKFKRLYDQNRDRDRNRLSDVQDANPKTYMAGDILGSLALPMGEVSKAADKLYGIKEGADASRALKAAKNISTGVVIGGTEGMGRSEHDFGTPEMNDDVLKSAGYGGLIPAAIEGTSAAAAKAIPAIENVLPEKFLKRWQEAKNLGRNKVDLKSDEFANDFKANDNSIAQESTDAIINQNTTNKAARDLNESNFNKDIEQKNSRQSLGNQKIASENDDRIQKIEKDFQNVIDTTKAQQVTDNQKLKEDLANKTAESARHLQTRLDGLKHGLTGEGGEYDQIYDSAKHSGIKIDTIPVISDFLEELRTAVPDEKIVEKVRGDLAPFSVDLDLERFKQLKRQINKYTAKSQLPGLRSAASGTFGRLGVEAQNQMGEQGFSDVYDALKSANKKYQAFMNYEGVDNLKANATTGERYGAKSTINSILDMASKDDPHTLESNRQFQDFYKQLAPVEELQPYQQLSQQVQDVNAFKPEVPKLQQALDSNSEYQDLLSEQQAMKAQKPIAATYEPAPLTEQEQTLAKLGKDQVSIKNNMLNSLPNFDKPFEGTVSANKEDFIKNLIESQQGPEAAQQFGNKVETQNIHRELGQSINPELRNAATQSGMWTNLFNTVTGGGTGNLANKIGLMESDPESKLNMFKKFMDNRKQAPVGPAIMNSIGDDQGKPTDDKKQPSFFKSSSNELMQSSQMIAQNPNAHAQTIAKKLEKAANADNAIQRNALLFSLMQDPTARNMIKNSNGNKDEIVS